MKKISRILSALTVGLLAVSCSSDDIFGFGSGKDTSVQITGLGYAYNQARMGRAETNATPDPSLVAVAYHNLGDGYLLAAELTQDGPIDMRQSRGKLDKGESEKEAVTSLDAVTFYNDTKRGSRLQTGLTTKVELPADDPCTVVYLGKVGNTATAITTNGSSAATATSVLCNQVQGVPNLCYKVTSHSKAPATVDLSDMKPLFAQIGSFGMEVEGTYPWPIEKVEGAMIIAGIQEESGAITISNTGVSYVKSDEDFEQSIGLNNGDFSFNSSSASFDIANQNVIPNANNLAINMNVTLKGKVAKNIDFKFDTPLASGFRYNIKLKIIKNSIKVRFNVNASQQGVYSESFSKEMFAQKVITNFVDAYGEGHCMVDPEDEGAYIFDICDSDGNTMTLTLPDANDVTREVYEDFNPMDVVEFKGWYYDQACTPGGKITLDVDIRQNDVTGNLIEFFAYWEPKFYYFDTEATMANGGAMSNKITNDGTGVYTSKAAPFSGLPTYLEYRDHYAKAPVFYDASYTYDNQPGYWICKYARKANYAENTERKVTNISGGNLPPGYKKEDFFFVPALGYFEGDSYSEDLRPQEVMLEFLVWARDAWFINNSAGHADEPEPGGVHAMQHAFTCKNGKAAAWNGVCGVPFLNHGVIAYWPDETYPTPDDTSIQSVGGGVSTGGQGYGGTQSFN